MVKSINIKKKIKKFNEEIFVNGDKSISIRWVLLSSLAHATSRAKNLLMSEDVKAAIKTVKKLGIKVKINKNFCEIKGNGIDGYNYKKNITLNAENSGTLGRLILGLLINTTEPIKLIGDKSLSKRDFKRVTDPLTKFGAKFKLRKNRYLPLTIFGSNKLNSINYFENKGSAQCKSSIIFGGLRAKGETIIKARKSRNHTELMLNHLNLPIKVKSKKKYESLTKCKLLCSLMFFD